MGDGVSPASRLCMACGMCCDSTLFPDAEMTHGDVAIALRLKLDVVSDAAGAMFFKQPCPHFKSCCTVYDQQKPGICSAFSCKSLRQLEKGSLRLGDAMALVEKARMLQKATHASFPAAKSSPLSHLEALDRANSINGNAALRIEHARFLLLFAAWHAHLKKHFYLK